MVALLQKIAESKLFQNFITAVILLAGVVVGLETYPGIMQAIGDELHLLDRIILIIFIAEVIIKQGAKWPRPWEYFKDPWNVFDFIIVAAALMPVDGQQVTVLRLLRLLRVLRLVRAVPRLQVLVSALLKSMPSMGYVAVLLLLLFYIYAVAGVFLFAQNDPVHFGSLQLALMTLFRVVTLEDWTDVWYTQFYGCDEYPYGFHDFACQNPQAMPIVASVYLVSFVLLGTMIFLNLMVGVVLNGIQEAQDEQAAAERDAHREALGKATAEDDLYDASLKLQELQDQIRRIQKRLAEEAGTRQNR